MTLEQAGICVALASSLVSIFVVLRMTSHISFPFFPGFGKKKKYRHGGHVLLQAGKKDADDPLARDGTIVVRTADGQIRMFMDNDGVWLAPPPDGVKERIDEETGQRYFERNPLAVGVRVSSLLLGDKEK